VRAGESGVAGAVEDGCVFGVVGDEQVAGDSQEWPQEGHVPAVVKSADSLRVVAEGGSAIPESRCEVAGDCAK
jgi:hypothetical protein